MLIPGLSKLQKVDNLATHVDLLTKFPTLIPNKGPHVVQKEPWEGVIYLQISDMDKCRNYSGRIAFIVD